jgi:hypothetical protein
VENRNLWPVHFWVKELSSVPIFDKDNEIGVGSYAPPTAAPETGSGTSVIFVSLYLLLLAFFIFLHSISVPKEERIRSVLGSVNIAFKGLSKETPADEQKTLSGEEQGTQQFHAKLRNVFETAVPLVESKITEGGTRLQFSIPLGQLFKSGSLELRGLKDDFLIDVAATLIRRNQNVATDVEILIGTGPRLPSSSDSANDLASRRIDGLAQHLMNQGVPSRNISIGLEQGDSGLVHFSFFLRPALTFQFRPDGGAQ